MADIVRKRKSARLGLFAVLCIGFACVIAGIVMGSEEVLPAAVPGGNNALFFDGVNDYLEIPEIAAIRTDKSEPLTVEFWAIVSSYGKTWHKVLSKWGARGGDDDEFVVVFREDGTFGFADTGSTGLGSRTLLPTNVWFHFCCVWDAVNGERKLYINGELIPQFLNEGAPLRLTGEPIRIGTDGHRNQCFKGMIDEVRLWNVARTQEDVRVTMNRRLSGEEPGLVGYWDFDEGQGQVVDDLSDKGNRGRLGRLPYPDDADPVWAASGVELFEPLGSTR
jgi:hypothetical protein